MFTVTSGENRTSFELRADAMAFARKLSETPVTPDNDVDAITRVSSNNRTIAEFCDGMLINLNGEEIN